MGGIEAISTNLPLTWTFSELLLIHIPLWSTLNCTKGEGSRKADIFFWLRLFDFPIITFVLPSEAVCSACNVIVFYRAYLPTWNEPSVCVSFLPSLCSYIIAVRVPPLKHNFPWRQGSLIRSQAFVRRCRICSHYTGLLTTSTRDSVGVCVCWCMIVWTCVLCLNDAVCLSQFIIGCIGAVGAQICFCWCISLMLHPFIPPQWINSFH